MDFFVTKTLQPALLNDIANDMETITFEVNKREEIDSLFSYSSYGKAPAILRMVYHIITPEVFRNGIIKYLDEHQFNSATSDDLWDALQAVLDESDVPHNAYKLKEVMGTWLKQRHYPVIRVTRNYDTGEMILKQEHFHPKSENDSVDSDKWWVPLTFTTQTNLDFSNTLPTHWLSPQDKNISIDGIDPNDWVIVNIQQTGYYRVNYDNSNWRKIAKYLNSDNYTKIHVLNRAQIIDDAYRFMIAEQLDFEIFLDLTNYLSRETDFVALYPMFSILEWKGDFFKFPEMESLKEYVLRILDELLKDVGYEDDPAEDDITKLKRYEILLRACDLGHSECRKMATTKLNELLANPETHKISSDLKRWVYCNGMMEANASTWNKLMDTYIITPDQNILDYLLCSENPDILINFINISISNDDIQNNTYNIISTIIQNHSDNNIIFDYILENLDEISAKSFPGKIDRKRILFDILYSVHSQELLDKLDDFSRSKLKGKERKHMQAAIQQQKSELADRLNKCDILNKFSSFIKNNKSVEEL